MTFSVSENETQQKLIDIWERVLKLHPIGINDSFCSLGGDSLALVQIHYLIEIELHYHLPISCIAKKSTIKEQAYLIDHKVCSSAECRSILLGDKFDKKPLIIIQPIFDGDYNVAKNLSRHLENDYSIIATLPIVNDNCLSIKECALRYIESIELQFPSKEYVIGGFSMGGLVALEMATIWKEKGTTVSAIFLLDTYHPAILNDIFMINPKVKRILFYLKKVLISNSNIRKEVILHLQGNFIGLIAGWLNKISRNAIRDSHTQTAIGNKKKLKAIMHKYVEISLNYLPKKSEDNIILITKSTDDNSFYYGDSQRYTNKNIESFKVELSENLSVHKIPASHATLIEEPNCAIIAKIMLNSLLD